ncbi:hypothetical protein [Macrococcoides caseolyticum]|nr:hypothetical protein [Macrococcus caseolyticus]MDJ1089852.1 hypothetical protein [Macrococcus caseolyticus]
MMISHKDIMEKYECVIIDEITFEILKDLYHERKFGLEDLQTKKEHIVNMLCNFDISDEQVLAEATMVPVGTLFESDGFDSSDISYCIVYKAGESLESP